MKKILFIAALLLTAYLLPSCTQFMDNNPIASAEHGIVSFKKDLAVAD